MGETMRFLAFLAFAALITIASQATAAEFGSKDEAVTMSKGPGSGWIDYKWPNPLTNKIEDKSSYVEKMGDYFVDVGVYKQ